MKLTEIEKIVEPKKETSNMDNLKPVLNLTDKAETIQLPAHYACLLVNLNADLKPSMSARSLMISKAKNSLIKLGELVSTLNLNWYIPKMKNGLK